MTIQLRKATVSDAPAIAHLIIEAMTEECCAHYYGSNYNIDDFHAFMTSLVEQDLTQYSYKNTLVAQSDDDIAGIAVSYNGAGLHQLRKAFVEGLYTTFHRDFRGRINDETQAGELYLDSLAVDPKFRRNGIGSLLLEATAQKAKNMKIPYVGLLVDDNNPTALHLYEQTGFHFVNKTIWGGHHMKHLQLKTDNLAFKHLTPEMAELQLYQ